MQDRGVQIVHVHLVFDGTMSEVLESKEVRTAYLGSEAAHA